jgi:hypothetical protein
MHMTWIYPLSQNLTRLSETQMNNVIRGLTLPLGNPHIESVDDFFYLDVVYTESVDDFFYLDVVYDSETLEQLRNATELWLYDSNCENYERLYKKVKSISRFEVASDLIPSYFHDYLLEEFIKCDKLAPELAKGKEINLNAITHWFIQYVQRARFKEGSDCHERSRGASTQSEVLKVKAHKEGRGKEYAHSHDLKRMASHGYEIANVVYKRDSETGQSLGTPDFYVSNRADDLEEQSENDYMRSLLLDRFGEEKVEMYYSLWLEIRYEEYASKRNWASARKVTHRVLVQQVEKVKGVFADNLEAFGY